MFKSPNALFNSPSVSCTSFQIQMGIFLPCPSQMMKAVFAVVFVLLFAFDRIWSLTISAPARVFPSSFTSPFSFLEYMLHVSGSRH